MRRRPLLARAFSSATIIAVALIVSMLASSQAGATPWFNGPYLYRYVFWGLRSEFSRSEAYKMFPYRTIETAPPPCEFPHATSGTLPAEVEYKDGDSTKRVALDQLLESSGTHAFIVLKDGKLIDERYLNGYQRDSICISRSVAKSFTSALVGIAIDEGFIKSVNDPVVNYIPELKDRGFDPITIRNLLTMGSGIRYRIAEMPWDEDALYFFYPNIRQMLLYDTEIAEPPGQSFQYTDFNVGLLAIIIERTTHRTLSDYLQEKIWKPLGMEYPALWSLDSERDGFELSHVALNARAIDFAKFGQLFLDNGRWNGKQIISEKWVQESTAPDPNDHRPWKTYPEWTDAGGYYKYFWWGDSSANGDYVYSAIGRWGQFVFVAPKANVVIVRTGSDFGIDIVQWSQVFRYIADSLGRGAQTGSAIPIHAP
ncbi:MAG TPA: serine hydrolase [Candidatus Binatus sp.]|nr:serine hydrolase [Candidatus Binatus sp.]